MPLLRRHIQMAELPSKSPGSQQGLPHSLSDDWTACQTIGTGNVQEQFCFKFATLGSLKKNVSRSYRHHRWGRIRQNSCLVFIWKRKFIWSVNFQFPSFVKQTASNGKHSWSGSHWHFLKCPAWNTPTVNWVKVMDHWVWLSACICIKWHNSMRMVSINWISWVQTPNVDLLKNLDIPVDDYNALDNTLQVTGCIIL